MDVAADVPAPAHLVHDFFPGPRAGEFRQGKRFFVDAGVSKEGFDYWASSASRFSI